MEDENVGFIYIATNKAMPGLCKIGCSENVLDRIYELYNHSGVPLPFEIVFVGEVENYKDVEKNIHKDFQDHRVNQKREFFKIKPDIIIPYIKEHFPTITDVTENIKEEFTKKIDAQDEEALTQYTKEKEKPQNKKQNKSIKKQTKDVRKNRPQFNFKKMGIKKGETIIYAKDKHKKAKVVDECSVKMYGKEPCSLTELTEEFLGYKAAPLPYWKYKNKLLSEYYDKTYGSKSL